MVNLAGIFAAGEGSRLNADFPGTVKPMFEISGRPLIEWGVLSLAEAGISEIFILLNSKGVPAIGHLEKSVPGVKFHFTVRNTSSSWESFSLLSGAMAEKGERFILTTVDSFYTRSDLLGFSRTGTDADILLAVTGRIRDEKPLWVSMDEKGVISEIGGDEKSGLATAGIYAISPEICSEMPSAEKYSALREYLKDMSRKGKNIRGFLVSDNVDVDTREDIPLAEEFIKKHFRGRGFP